MEAIEKKFIVDEQNRKIAVQIDIKDFEKIEDIIENYALFRIMKEYENEAVLDIEAAKSYYKTLEKAG